MSIRPFHSEDIAEVLAVFVDAIMQIAAEDYTPEQCQAWAAAGSLDRWPGMLSQGLALVAIDPQGIVAFGHLNPVDHINLLYCRGRGRGQGHATQILAGLEAAAMQHGVTQLSTEASLTARRFFERRGYHVQVAEVVDRQGVLLPRWRMCKPLTSRYSER
jgi:putative acetyltransferase